MSTRKISHRSPVKAILYFCAICYERNTKHCFRIDIQLYQHSWKIEKPELCENTRPCARRVSTKFLVSPISTRVDITVYQYGKRFIFLKYKSWIISTHQNHSRP